MVNVFECIVKKRESLLEKGTLYTQIFNEKNEDMKYACLAKTADISNLLNKTKLYQLELIKMGFEKNIIMNFLTLLSKVQIVNWYVYIVKKKMKLDANLTSNCL